MLQNFKLESLKARIFHILLIALNLFVVQFVFYKKYSMQEAT